jgi:hypothetical protein
MRGTNRAISTSVTVCAARYRASGAAAESNSRRTRFMPRQESGDDTKRRKAQETPVRRNERASPGSGEDEQAEPADLQPDEVGDDTAR